MERDPDHRALAVEPAEGDRGVRRELDRRARDFAYVATHIGDSIKRKLKREGEQGIQGEFGIGLLSFWTVGEELTMTSRDTEAVVRKMHLVKDSPAYSIRESRELFDQPGTMLEIRPILSGVRVLSGEKIQSYRASELRDSITKSGVHITIVERVGLYKNGTRVIEDLSTIDELAHELVRVLRTLDPALNERIAEQQRAGTPEGTLGEAVSDGPGAVAEREPAFFEMPGPLFRVDIRPAKATIAVGAEHTFAAAESEAMITVTAELLRSQPGERASGKGLPCYLPQRPNARSTRSSLSCPKESSDAHSIFCSPCTAATIFPAGTTLSAHMPTRMSVMATTSCSSASMSARATRTMPRSRSRLRTSTRLPTVSSPRTAPPGGRRIPRRAHRGGDRPSAHRCGEAPRPGPGSRSARPGALPATRSAPVTRRTSRSPRL